MQTTLPKRQIVSREQWLEARQALLAEEKALTRQRDEVNRQRLELPWVKLDKNYVFDGPNGRESLADLFASRSQLLVYHFMFGPEWEAGCPSCSFIADHFDGAIPHLNARDVTLVAISRAPHAKLAAFQRRMGWKFKWVSSLDGDFNYDFHVSFRLEEIAKGEVYYNYQEMGGTPVEDLPGASAFYRDDAGELFHTYSSYARGLDLLLGAYNFLDVTPKGRNEEGLAFSMAWVRHHDRYGDGYVVDPLAQYAPPKGSVCGCCS